MLRVLIDAQTMGDPDSAGRGFGRYVSAMLDSLPAEPGVELSALVLPNTPLPAGVRPVPMRRWAAPEALEWRTNWEQHVLRLGFDIRRAKPDVFHSPRTEPPLFCSVPWVQTLHDLISLVYKDPTFDVERRRWRFRAPLMRRADAVIAISRYTADLGIKHLGLKPERIHVVYHGVTPVFGPRPSDTEPDTPFVLYVGAFAAHKGFAEAFEVAARLADAGLPHVLKLVGGMNPVSRPMVTALRDQARHPERIELLDHVDDEDLVRLYSDATALVVTSRYEGFGRPTIEALACGTPVVCFDNSSLPEILGDAGILVPDGDVDRFGDELVRLIRDTGLQQELAARALVRAKTFDWGKCADEHVEIYRSVAS